MSRQEIAKILFQFDHQIFKNDKKLEEEWKTLPKTRDWTCPYTTCKDEYLRMADGVRKKILPPKEPSAYSKEELAEISWK